MPQVQICDYCERIVKDIDDYVVLTDGSEMHAECYTEKQEAKEQKAKKVGA